MKKLIVLDSEMARVALIERGSCVCLFHWHQLRARNNVCSCSLPGHSVRLSRTPPPGKALQSEGRSRKETAHVPSWNRESGALAVGKMLTKYFQLWTTTSGASEDKVM